MIDYQAIWNEVTSQCRCGVSDSSIHGPEHWKRVEAVGLKIARLVNNPKVDEDVIKLFAVFHDSRRLNDNDDPQHGYRAADYVRKVRGRLFDLDDARFELLFNAIAWHADGFKAKDPTIAVCFDADRMDLRRIGIEPDPALMSNWQIRNMLRPRS